jgi:uncharacterized protein YecE (DUF72 family)
LRTWVRRLGDSWDADADAFVYFNNDLGGAAVRDATRFIEIAAAAGCSVGRRPAHSGTRGV